SGLILDFWSWENTYYTALQSRLPLHDIVIIFGSEEAGIQKEKIGQLIKEHPDGVILLKKNSPLFHEILLDNNQLRFKWIDTPLTIQDIFHNDELMVFKYVCPGEKKSILRDH
ncbi:MAG: hypothetical protein NT126_04685, partial [Bacteroidetes bacterium]|nr:hypothetical protein [Bacteroidota bacterium]